MKILGKILLTLCILVIAFLVSCGGSVMVNGFLFNSRNSTIIENLILFCLIINTLIWTFSTIYFIFKPSSKMKSFVIKAFLTVIMNSILLGLIMQSNCNIMYGVGCELGLGLDLYALGPSLVFIFITYKIWRFTGFN